MSQPPATSVCAWCKHVSWSRRGNLSGNYQRVCLAGIEPWVYGRKFDPVSGQYEHVVLRKGGLPEWCDNRNRDGRCELYEPTWFTRLAWWRRVP